MSKQLYYSMKNNTNIMDKTLFLFYVLSNKTRLNILLLLCIKDMNVKQIVEELCQTQSSISHQLALLKEMKLVKAEKIGRENFYSLSDNHIEFILSIAIHHVSEEYFIDDNF